VSSACEGVCVPLRQVPAMLEAIGRVAQRHDVLIANIAHAGDGNLHPLLITDPGDEPVAVVSEQTVYSRVGNKAAILKAVYDVMLIGDDEPTPMAARPEFRRLQDAEDVGSMFASYARLARLMAQRMRPLLELVWGVRAMEPDLDRLARTAAEERRIGARMFAESLLAAGFARPGVDVDTAATSIWVLNAPEVYLLQVRDGGLTDDQYEQWLAGALDAGLA
jgi:AcrR family transcriptional regulator